MKSSIYDWMKEGHILVPKILINHYAELGLEGDELVLILYLLSKISANQNITEIDSISSHLGMEMSRVFQALETLLKKDYLAIELVENAQGKQTDHYTLRPLFEKLDQEYFTSQVEDRPLQMNQESQGLTAKDLVARIEKNFGRVLNPIELEMITDWLRKDHYSPELIHLALREALIRQAYNLNYIDKILLNWQKQNIQTVAEAEQQIAHYQEKWHDKSKNEVYDQVEIPLYDWNDLKHD